MPSYVIADMFGIPHEDGVALYNLTEAIHAAPESQAAGAAMAAVHRDVQLRDRRVGGPAGRTGRRPRHASSPTRPSTATRLDVIDFDLFFLLLIDAGGDTTRNLVAGGIDALSRPPGPAGLAHRGSRRPAGAGRRGAAAVGQPRRLHAPDGAAATPSCTACASPPARRSSCTTARPTAIPEAFGPTAGALDLARTPNEHIAFGGGGPHFCLGAHIARVEIHALLRELLTRLVDLRRSRRDGVAAVDLHLRTEAPADHLRVAARTSSLIFERHVRPGMTSRVQLHPYEMA